MCLRRQTFYANNTLHQHVLSIVCVCERERERGGGGGRDRFYFYFYIKQIKILISAPVKAENKTIRKRKKISGRRLNSIIVKAESHAFSLAEDLIVLCIAENHISSLAEDDSIVQC